MEVTELRRVDADAVNAMRKLIRQLSSSAAPMTSEKLEELVQSDSCTVLVARHDGGIVGTLTLVVFPIPTGVRAWIEDVVVDASARGQGVGIALTRHALDLARTFAARTVDLTSRPSRDAANAMYEKLGFHRRETIVYRYELTRRRRVHHYREPSPGRSVPTERCPTGPGRWGRLPRSRVTEVSRDDSQSCLVRR